MLSNGSVNSRRSRLREPSRSICLLPLSARRGSRIIAVALGLILFSASFSVAQCVRCDASLVDDSIYVNETVQTVHYVPQVREEVRQVRYVRAQETGIGFDLGCAVQAAEVFRDCRANGGGVLPCLLDGAITYLSCPGDIVRQRMRARRSQRRARFNMNYCR